MDQPPHCQAAELIAQLRTSSGRLVLAESCTCGMTAAILGGVAGASEVFCGSAVTYREAVKTEWLGVPTDTLRQFTAESQQATDQMARGVLQRTGDANWAAAITGHLGPGAPPAADGHVFLSLFRRSSAAPEPQRVAQHDFVLTENERKARQIEAADAMIRWILMRTKEAAVALDH